MTTVRAIADLTAKDQIDLWLWDALDTASKTPVDADWLGLLDRVGQSINILCIIDN